MAVQGDSGFSKGFSDNAPYINAENMQNNMKVIYYRYFFSLAGLFQFLSLMKSVF